METIYYALVAVVFFLAIGNWRAGLYACIVLDVLRDPVRKLCTDEPVAVTIAAAFVWFGVFIGVINAHRAELLHSLRWGYPNIRKALVCLVVALIPGFAISLAFYDRGYVLAVIGSVSYLAPLMGLAIGFAFPRTRRDTEHLLAFYTVLNSILLIGAPLEYSGSDMPGLGGISMDWIRQMHGLHVDLIAGFCRSPDILGLHAAHVVVFSAILALRAKGPGRIGWSTLATWGGICLLLAGRRKSMAVPFIFVSSYLLLSLWRSSRLRFKAGLLAALVSLVTAATLALTREAEISTVYTDYASTLVTRGGTRSKEIVVGSIVGTLRQSGLLGDGLGTATQGSHYAGVTLQRRAWQEDGASRVFKELGVPGLLFIGLAAVLFGQALFGALKIVPAWHTVGDLQICLLSVVVANVACFIASHQIYSGDPCNSLLVVAMLGMVFGVVRIYRQEQHEGRSTKSEGRRGKRLRLCENGDEVESQERTVESRKSETSGRAKS